MGGGHPLQVAQAGPSIDPNVASTIRALISNPQTRAYGLQLYGQFATGGKPTDDMRELNAVNAERKARGEAPMGLLDYQVKLKEAGKPVTNINQQQESEYEKSAGKHFADLNFEIPKMASSARGKIATLDRLGSLLSDPNVTTGAGANAILEAKRLAKQIGIDVGDLGPAEAVRAISNQFALELRNPQGGAGMPGALSDKDREFLQSMVPGLLQNPAGNKLIIDYMKRVAQRSVDVERLRQSYVRKNGRLNEGFFNELADYSEAHPLFADADNAPVQTPAAQTGAPSIDDLLKKYGPQ
jgi:hypothetical protein